MDPLWSARFSAHVLASSYSVAVPAFLDLILGDVSLLPLAMVLLLVIAKARSIAGGWWVWKTCCPGVLDSLAISLSCGRVQSPLPAVRNPFRNDAVSRLVPGELHGLALYRGPPGADWLPFPIK